MLIGGPTDPEALKQGLARFRTALDGVLDAARGMPTSTRPEALVDLLHRRILRRYTPAATTLFEVVERGEYSATSAALVYWLAAQELDIDARPVLLETHVRIVVADDAGAHVVEPVSDRGFEPTPEVERELLSRLQGVAADSLVLFDQHGVETDVFGLFAAIYSNLAAYAHTLGLAALEAAITERCDALAPAAARRQMRIARAHAMAYVAAGRPADEALPILERARAFVDDEALFGFVDRLALGTFARHMRAAAKHMDVRDAEKAFATMRPFVTTFEDARATAYLEVGRAALERDDLKVATQAGGLGLAVPARAELHRSLVALEWERLSRLSEVDPRNAGTAFLLLAVEPHDGDYLDAAQTVAYRALQALARVGECATLEREKIEWQRRVEDPSLVAVAAYCYSVRAQKLLDAKSYETMAKEMRHAMKIAPEDPRAKENLLVALSNQASALVQENRCDAARPLLEEGRRLKPGDAFIQETLRYCGGR